MTYISHVPLNPLRRDAQFLLQNPQRLHAAVMGSVPYQSESGRHLWRLDQNDHQVDLFVLSPTRPSWDHLIEQAGWPQADGGEARVLAYDHILALLMVGRRFRFRLRANPVQNVRRPEKPTSQQTVRMNDPEKTRGIRVGQRTAGYQLKWFLSRCSDGDDRWGFTVGPLESPSVALVERKTLQFSKGRGLPQVTLNTATFEGELTVTNVDLMRRSLLEGIGGGKAYGCGLLTLAAA